LDYAQQGFEVAMSLISGDEVLQDASSDQVLRKRDIQIKSYGVLVTVPGRENPILLTSSNWSHLPLPALYDLFANPGLHRLILLLSLLKLPLESFGLKLRRSSCTTPERNSGPKSEGQSSATVIPYNLLKVSIWIFG
jgi:hypothetical protein